MKAAIIIVVVLCIAHGITSQKLQLSDEEQEKLKSVCQTQCDSDTGKKYWQCFGQSVLEGSQECQAAVQEALGHHYKKFIRKAAKHHFRDVCSEEIKSLCSDDVPHIKHADVNDVIDCFKKHEPSQECKDALVTLANNAPMKHKKKSHKHHKEHGDSSSTTPNRRVVTSDNVISEQGQSMLEGDHGKFWFSHGKKHHASKAVKIALISGGAVAGIALIVAGVVIVRRRRAANARPSAPLSSMVALGSPRRDPEAAAPEDLNDAASVHSSQQEYHRCDSENEIVVGHPVEVSS